MDHRVEGIAESDGLVDHAMVQDGTRAGIGKLPLHSASLDDPLNGPMFVPYSGSDGKHIVGDGWVSIRCRFLCTLRRTSEERNWVNSRRLGRNSNRCF